MDDYPEVRPVDAVKAEMMAIARRCGTPGLTTAEAADMADRALTLVLELRVPRMPDTEEELAEMLRDAEGGTTYSSDEVLAHLAEHSTAFGRFRERFREQVASGDVEGAARSLGPDDAEGAPSWEGTRPTVSTGEADGRVFVTVSRDGRSESCMADTLGTALLGAAMRCHAHWDDIRRR